MIGIDLVENKRIADDLERLANKILSREELTYYNSIKLEQRKIEYVASRWAAKEAIYKALKSNLGKSYKDFSILNEEDGSPYIKSNLELNFNISLSHTKEYSVAVVIII